MTIHIVANTSCNLGCTYCYEEPDREVTQEDVDREYDIELIMERLEKWKEKYPNQVPGMHGGEPLLMRDEHLERIFSWIHENYDEGGHIQTNGTLITEKHIGMFEKYNVSVGVSADGPEELNDLRKARSGQEDATRLMTEKTHENLEKLMDSNAGVGVIVVLNEQNAGNDEKLEKLLDWMDYLNKNGSGGHFNPAIPYEDVQEDDSLSPERLKEVYLRTWEWMKEEPYRRWGPMRQYQNNLLGIQLGNCVNQTCDVFNTRSAQIVKGNGESTGCGKTWSAVGDGGSFLQGDATGNEYEETEERYEMLKQVPGPHTEGEEDQGGCKGCPFWNVCNGGCPSSPLDYDYRNRTRWCKAKYALYEKIEKDMRAIMPGIRLVTDLDWDVDIAHSLSHGGVDIKPFAGISPARSRGRPTVTGGPHDEESPWKNIIDDSSFDKKVEKYREKYDESILTIKPEENSIHADSSNRGESR